MGFFPSVSPDMNGQGAALDEALVATLDGAVIRSLIGMDALMSGKVGLPIKRLTEFSEWTVRPLNSKEGRIENVPSHILPKYR